ncbi:hypothetical protein LSAT2_005991 [Lamellibrachia satsuma]|nr:hypothetical protein LSAT2_005991 [Lamellibrachia satsuma]
MLEKSPSPYLEMDSIRFTLPAIDILLKNISQTKAADPDEFPTRILKETTKEISYFKLYCVFTKGNFTLEVDIGMNYTGVVGDQLLKCLDCRMDGMGCYLVPLSNQHQHTNAFNAGHVERMEGERLTERLDALRVDGRRSRGRPTV